MVQYLAIPRSTVEWLLENKTIVQALADVIGNDLEALSELPGTSIGPLRFRRDPSERLMVIWNIDYTSVSGEDPVGFIRIAAPHSFLDSDAQVLEASFERMLFIMHQRFLNRLFLSHFFYRRLPSGGQKIAGPRGVGGEAQNIGFAERTIQGAQGSVRTMILAGPEYDWDKVAEAAVGFQADLDWLVNAMLEAAAQPATSPMPSPIAKKLSMLSNTTGTGMPVALPFTQRTRGDGISPQDVYRTLAWTFTEWMAADSSLVDEQRFILESDLILRNPLRIVGPAGSGKTLLVQLLAMKLLQMAPKPMVLYITHNEAMRVAAKDRFLMLGALDDMQMGRLQIATLAGYMNELTGVASHHTLSIDPEKAKIEQDKLITFALEDVISKRSEVVANTPTLSALTKNESSRRVLVELIKADISTAIKARGSDRDAYVESEFALGPLHATLSPDERNIIFDVFEVYETELGKYEVLDHDDVALTMLSQLRSPKWKNLQRKVLGFDYILVDEAQLFNDNEAQVFPLLAKGDKHFAPVVLALDAAQDLYSTSKSGLGSLGIKGVQRGVLASTHRMPTRIARLAYYVLSKTAGLFSEDFPDFTTGADNTTTDAGGGGSAIVVTEIDERIGRRVNKLVRDARARGLRQFAIVCHDQARFDSLRDELAKRMDTLDFMVVEERGQRPKSDHPFVLFCRPELVGGQEFDAVYCVGLEEGIVPIRVPDNYLLEQTLEQQALKEMYLAFSRARHEVAIIVANDRDLTPLLKDAVHNGFLKEPQRVSESN